MTADATTGSRGPRVVLAWVCACALLLGGQFAVAAPVVRDDASASSQGRLRVGHWVEIKGELRDDVFVADSIEVLAPAEQEWIVASASDVAPDGSTFTLLGQPVQTSARTEWEGVDPSTLPSAQVKVEGHYRGPGRFSAREVSVRRKPGRDRIAARVDELLHTPEGLQLVVMRFTVLLPPGVEPTAEGDLGSYALAPARPVVTRRVGRDDDDDIPGTLRLGEDVTFGGQFEVKLERRGDPDLDRSARDDVRESEESFRGEVVWDADEDAYLLVGFRGRLTTSRREEQPVERTRDGVLTEAYALLRDPLSLGFDVQLGRQDFDDAREWIYDENLDAVRLVWNRADLRVELSASTVLADGGPRNRETTNFMAYVSNADDDRHLAAWIVDRRRTDTDRRQDRDKPILAGVRALGAWIPENEVWAELALLRGYGHARVGGETVERVHRGWAFDLGTTWSPSAAEPFSFTVGFARASGDRDPSDTTDTSFRQTGLQDDNGRFAGVTSFRYYGEVLDPELSNLSVLTLGAGARITPKTSVDLVYHEYTQVVAAGTLVDTRLDAKPDGVHRDLGRGLDLVFGTRAIPDWDLEIVVGTLRPGAAFPGADDAWLAALQVRRRF